MENQVQRKKDAPGHNLLLKKFRYIIKILVFNLCWIKLFLSGKEPFSILQIRWAVAGQSQRDGKKVRYETETLMSQKNKKNMHLKSMAMQSGGLENR